MKADYPALSCGQCNDDMEAGEPDPDCERCPLGQNPLSEENQRIVDMADMIRSADMRMDTDLLGAWLGPMSRQGLQTALMKISMIRAMRGDDDGGH